MGFFDKIKEIVTESDDDEYDDFMRIIRAVQ